MATISSDLMDRIYQEGWVDTRKYRYIAVSRSVARRMPLEYLDTTRALGYQWETVTVREDKPTAYISLDNGHSYMTAAEALVVIGEGRSVVSREDILNVMDDDIREAVHSDLAPCTDEAFLGEYLRRSPVNLIVG